jgi:Cys-rich protein (TIGR01571 family)
MLLWHYSLFQCCDDQRVMCDTCWCPYCSVGRQWGAVRGTNNHLDIPCCLASFCLSPLFPLFTAAVRLRVIQKYQLDERTLAAFCRGACCSACSACQTYRELNVRGAYPGRTLPDHCGPQPGLLISEDIAGFKLPSRSISRV